MTVSTRAADAIRRIHEATSGSTGEAFFFSLSRAMAEVLETRFAFVAEILSGAARMRSLAVWDGAGFAQPFEYDLEHTPCAHVLAGDHCQYPADVQRAFPADVMLVEWGIRAYYGVPILGMDGQPRGILVGLHDAPREHIADLETILGMFSVRAAAELDRRDAEAALRESERRYREIVTTCAEGVWQIDANGFTTFVNEPMARMLGYTPAELMGRTLFDLMDEAGRQRTLCNIERRKQGIRERHPFELLHRDGSTVYTWMNTNPITGADGAYAGALAMVTDVTQQLALERRVREAQKLESLGLLAGGIAHDFNNLLVGVLGRADIALIELPHGHAVRPLVEGIRDTAERAAELTRQLLAYAGKAPLAVGNVDLNRSVSEIAALCRSTAGSQVTLELELAAQSVIARSDPSALTQVVLNLITNAIQAIGTREGRVIVQTSLEQVQEGVLSMGESSLAPGAYAVLRVRDTGSGMDAATSARVFDPFFTTKQGGRGLGLAAVRGIVRTHEGAITVTSAPGAGTTFTVHLPASDDHAVSEHPSGVRAPKVGGGRILVVDDESSVREVVQIALESAGYEVEVVADGREALTRFSSSPESCVAVLLDVTMPGLSGFEVGAAMRALRPNVALLMMSGFTGEAVPSAMQGVPFLQKPFRVATLLEALTKLLGASNAQRT